jgi:hypothetical protein
MKKITVAIFLGLFAACASAAPSDKLVEDYLRAIMAKESIDAQVSGFAKQYATSSTPEDMVEINRYLNTVMGWDVVKPQYIKIIQEIYTTDEINASLAFIESELGKSISEKNIVFSEKVSTLMAKNTQAFTQSQLNSEPSLGDGAGASVPSSLSIIDLERHQVSDQTYFTGKVVNVGKKLARGVQIEINLFRDEKFVDQYSTYIPGTVPSGGERFFKVICGCKGSQPAVHDSFKALAIETY